jgi:hypothetical protein
LRVLADLPAEADPNPASSQVCLGAGAVAAGRLVVTDLLGGAFAYNIATDQWNVIAPFSARPSLYITTPLAVDDTIVTATSDGLQVLGPHDTEWVSEPSPRPLHGGVGEVLAADGPTIYAAAKNSLQAYRIS